MNRTFAAVALTLSVGLCSSHTAQAQDVFYYGPTQYYASPPVVYAPVYVAPAPVRVYRSLFRPVYRPVVVQPVVVAQPVVVQSAWATPAYVTPHRVTVRSTPWFHKTEYEYYTPYGIQEVEYKVDWRGRVTVEYDD